ncbi:hypothetical protein [Tsukamurella paurometabola]|uniref:Capsular polysaccharide biosynthesis protein n=1 Tax=Tsukamurella paurometabola TaxID=2061 RepID=A0A3P8L5X1_TSUPA|nr:hypothetical protein [Tsukamurella paurometabola]UEA81358.1 hypothetical protein LK411_13150 [Tsukamurella paurometabola]VDR38341.1 Uncharacterised protein [Tsukamurella paurometabola]
MNVAGFLRWALTKPVIILLVLVAAVAGGVMGYRSTSSHFETSAAVLVIPPGAGSRNAMDNPFTGLNNGAAQVAHVLTTVGQSADARAVLEKEGASPDVVMTAMAGDGNSQQISPLITFTVSAPEAWRARAGANALIEYWRAEFRKMQVEAGVVGDTFADLRVPVAPKDGVEVGGNPLRASLGLAMGAALATLTLCLIAAAAWEVIRKRRTGVGDDPLTETIPTQTSGAPAAVVDAHTDSPVLSDLVQVGPGPDPEAPPAEAPRAVPAAVPIRPPGDAARRAMTRWRDRVEEVPEETEIPLPDFDDTGSDEGAQQAKNA